MKIFTLIISVHLAGLRFSKVDSLLFQFAIWVCEFLFEIHHGAQELLSLVGKIVIKDLNVYFIDQWTIILILLQLTSWIYVEPPHLMKTILTCWLNFCDNQVQATSVYHHHPKLFPLVLYFWHAAHQFDRFSFLVAEFDLNFFDHRSAIQFQEGFRNIIYFHLLIECICLLLETLCNNKD